MSTPSDTSVFYHQDPQPTRGWQHYTRTSASWLAENQERGRLRAPSWSCSTWQLSTSLLQIWSLNKFLKLHRCLRVLEMPKLFAMTTVPDLENILRSSSRWDLSTWFNQTNKSMKSPEPATQVSLGPHCCTGRRATNYPFMALQDKLVNEVSRAHHSSLIRPTLLHC